MKRYLHSLLFILFVTLIFTSSHAEWQPLDDGLADSSSINALAVDDAGNLYVGGSFSIAGGQPVNNIAKWNGENWESLGTGVNGTVNALAVDSTGQLYAGGSFTMAGEVPVNYIARWNGQQWAALGNGIEHGVKRLAINSMDVLYANGPLSNGNSYLVRWENESWQSMDIPAGQQYVLAIDGQDNLYVVGMDPKGTTWLDNYLSLFKWDGTRWEKPEKGNISGNISSNLVIDNAGYSYLATAHAGHHVSVSGVVNGWDGISWKWLGTYVSGSPNLQSSISALAVDTTGQLYMGGNFTIPAHYIAQWNRQDNQWQSLGRGLNDSVSTLITDKDGNLYAGGAFTRADGIVTNHIARWNGSQWEALGTGIGDLAILLVVDKADRLYAGGHFLVLGSNRWKISSNVIQWEKDHWQSLGYDIEREEMTGTISDFTVDAMNNLYIGGHFYTGSRYATGGSTPHSIAKRHDTGWEKYDGIETVSALVMDDSYNFYAAGHSTIDGVTTFGIYQWISDHWAIFGTTDQVVQTLAIDTKGRLYAGGCFHSINGISALATAQWEGTSWQPMGAGLDDCVDALEIDRAGNVYAGGRFIQSGELAVNHIAKWATDHWEALNNGVDAPVLTLVSNSKNHLYVGGRFTHAGEISARYIAKWVENHWETFGNGANGFVSTLAVDSLDNVYMGGFFTDIDGIRAYRVARWNHNQIPTAIEVGVTGTPALGETLVGHYTYQDSENDPEGLSTFQWYWANDATCTLDNKIVSYSLSSEKSYLINSLSEYNENKYLCFEVTPTAITGTYPGLPVAIVAAPPLTGFLAPIDDQVVEINEHLTLTTVATHPKGQPLKMSFYSSDYLDGATMDPTTGIFEWTPTYPGDTFIEICAKETEGTILDCRKFKVTVKDSPGFSRATAIDQQGQKTYLNSVHFTGNIILEDEFGTSITATSRQELTVTAQQNFKVIVDINPDSQHVGQQADLLLVIATEPPPEPYYGNEDTVYRTVDQNNHQKIVDLYADYRVWMPQFDAPFVPAVTLETNTSMIQWQGTLTEPALYYFFMGYRLSDGSIVYNSRPLRIKVQ